MRVLTICIDLQDDLTPRGVESTVTDVAYVVGEQQYALTAGKVELRGVVVAEWRVKRKTKRHRRP